MLLSLSLFIVFTITCCNFYLYVSRKATGKILSDVWHFQQGFLRRDWALARKDSSRSIEKIHQPVRRDRNRKNHRLQWCRLNSRVTQASRVPIRSAIPAFRISTRPSLPGLSWRGTWANWTSISSPDIRSSRRNVASRSRYFSRSLHAVSQTYRAF